MSASKRTTKGAALSNRAAVLLDLSAKVWLGVTARDAAVAALIAAGHDAPDVMAIVERTYVARRAFPQAETCTQAMLDEAQRILALPGAGSKAVEKRTPEQEKFALGARQYKFGILKSAGISSSSPKAGNTNAAKGDATPANPVANIPSSKAGPPSAREAKFETTLDLRNHFYQMAKTFGLMLEKYESICDAKTRGVVVRFIKDTAGWEKQPDA